MNAFYDLSHKQRVDSDNVVKIRFVDTNKVHICGQETFDKLSRHYCFADIARWCKYCIVLYITFPKALSSSGNCRGTGKVTNETACF